MSLKYEPPLVFPNSFPVHVIRSSPPRIGVPLLPTSPPLSRSGMPGLFRTLLHRQRCGLALSALWQSLTGELVRASCVSVFLGLDRKTAEQLGAGWS